MKTSKNERPVGGMISAAVAATFSVPVRDVMANSRRSAPVVLARWSAMYLAHVELGMSFTDVGRAFGRNRTTAARACELIEERREEPDLDAALNKLAHAVRRDFGKTAAVAR
jgi:chromosomal replication initiation ATPase DnaA